jgi:hypothetical protein
MTTHNRCYSKNIALSIAIKDQDSHLWHHMPGFPAEGLDMARYAACQSLALRERGTVRVSVQREGHPPVTSLQSGAQRH